MKVHNNPCIRIFNLYKDKGRVMKLRIGIYNLLVNRISVIQKEYHKIRLEKTGMSGRIYAWLMLLWMNICWICGSRKL